MTSTRSPEATTIRRPARSGGTETCGVGPGGAPRSRPRRPPRRPAPAGSDDRLMDDEPAVDDVQQDGLARHEIDDGRLERVVAGDDDDRREVVGRARRDPRRDGRTGSAAATDRTTTAAIEGAARSRRRRLRPRGLGMAAPSRRGGTCLTPGPGHRIVPASRRRVVPADRAIGVSDAAEPTSVRTVPFVDGTRTRSRWPPLRPSIPRYAPAQPARRRASAVRLEGLVKHFGNTEQGRRAARYVEGRAGDVVAVDGIDLDVRDGEFFSMLGPSGSGKTTTLRMIAGFELPTAGPDPAPRPRRDRGAAVRARRQHGLPGLRALPAHDRRRERRLRADGPEGATRRNGPRASTTRSRMVRLDGYEARKPEPALGRPATAGRAGPGARQPARGCCCSTSRSVRSTSSSARRCRSSSRRSSSRSGSRSSTSPTTRRRRSR